MDAPHPLSTYRTLSSRPVVDVRVFQVRCVTRASSGREAPRDYHVIDAPSWVNVVARTPAGDVVLVRQERHGIEGVTLEVPGGMVDPGEDPATAAVRELSEETGYAGRPPVELGWVHPNPAIQSNKTFTYLVEDAAPAGDPDPQDDEEFQVLAVPHAAVRDLVRRGEITHALSVVALYLLDLRSDVLRSDLREGGAGTR
jgi:ADP-ribose pyrophosphatase